MDHYRIQVDLSFRDIETGDYVLVLTDPFVM